MVTTGNIKSIQVTFRSMKPASTYSKSGCFTRWISERTTGRYGPSLTICGAITNVTQMALTRCSDDSAIECDRHGSGNASDTEQDRKSTSLNSSHTDISLMPSFS